MEGNISGLVHLLQVPKHLSRYFSRVQLVFVVIPRRDSRFAPLPLYLEMLTRLQIVHLFLQIPRVTSMESVIDVKFGLKDSLEFRDRLSKIARPTIIAAAERIGEETKDRFAHFLLGARLLYQLVDVIE